MCVEKSSAATDFYLLASSQPIWGLIKWEQHWVDRLAIAISERLRWDELNLNPAHSPAHTAQCLVFTPVSKLVCSHLELRHLMLSSQTEEPEVYPLSTRHFGSRKYSFGPIRSFYSDFPKHWPYLFGPCTFVIFLPTPKWNKMSTEALFFLLRSDLSWKNHSRYNQVIQGHKKALLNTHWPCALFKFVWQPIC